MNYKKIIPTLAFAAAILTSTGCPAPNKEVQAIGEISGTISWDKGGERPDPSVIGDAISITPVTSTNRIPLTGATVVFGNPSDSGSRVMVTYKVSKLPLDTAIQLEVKPKRVQGSFLRDGNPQDAICTLAQPTVSNFDFHFVPAPK